MSALFFRISLSAEQEQVSEVVDEALAGSKIEVWRDLGGEHACSMRTAWKQSHHTQAQRVPED